MYGRNANLPVQHGNCCDWTQFPPPPPLKFSPCDWRLHFHLLKAQFHFHFRSDAYDISNSPKYHEWRYSLLYLERKFYKLLGSWYRMIVWKLKKTANLRSYQFAIQTSEDCLRGYLALTKLVEGGRKEWGVGNVGTGRIWESHVNARS